MTEEEELFCQLSHPFQYQKSCHQRDRVNWQQIAHSPELGVQAVSLAVQVLSKLEAQDDPATVQTNVPTP